MKSISVFIIDDHKVFTQGLSALLNQENDIVIIGIAYSLAEAETNLTLAEPDVVLLDISLKDEIGLDIIDWLRAKYPICKILVLSMHREETYIKLVLDSGANGYLLKDEDLSEVIFAIRAVYEGKSFYSNEILASMVSHLVEGKKLKFQKNDDVLTPREVEILIHIAEEKSNQEIANLLYLSVRTIDTHRQNIMEKLDIKNAAGLVRYAFKKGYIEL